MKRLGKRAKRNLEARKEIAKIAQKLGLTYCEIRLEGCLNTFGLAPVHRHKRIWYYDKPKLLSDYSQWVAGCQKCHQWLESDRELTESVFIRLRGIENINNLEVYV